MEAGQSSGVGLCDRRGGKTPGDCPSLPFPGGSAGCRDVSLLLLVGWRQVPLPFLMKTKQGHALPAVRTTTFRLCGVNGSC